MKTDILVSKLVAAGVGVAGQTIFVHTMPANAERGVMIKLPEIKIDANLPRFYCEPIQVIIREQSETAGALLADQVIAALHTYETKDYIAADSTRVKINYMLARHLPYRYRRSDGNGIEWSINFETCWVQ